MRIFISVIALLCSAAVCFADARVWVQPFDELTPNQQPDWLNRALRQSLMDELAASGANVISSETKPADANMIVAGTIQRIDGELRVSGQVTDAASGDTVGGFKATGNQRELFAIQDAIGQQVSKAIAPEPKVAVAQAPTQPAADGAAPRIEAPFAPARFGYEGSELQDAVRRGGVIEPRPVIRYETPVYPQYVQPVGYGPGYHPGYSPYRYGYGFGGFGFGFRSTPSVVIIKSGHGGKHHGGSFTPSRPHPGVSGLPPLKPAPGVIHTIGGFSGKNPPPPGVIHTIGR